MQVETPLADWVAAATRRLRPGGWLTLICGADGLPQVLGAMAPKLGSAAVLPLAAREGRAALAGPGAGPQGRTRRLSPPRALRDP